MSYKADLPHQKVCLAYGSAKDRSHHTRPRHAIRSWVQPACKTHSAETPGRGEYSPQMFLSGPGVIAVRPSRRKNLGDLHWRHFRRDKPYRNRRTPLYENWRKRSRSRDVDTYRVSRERGRIVDLPAHSNQIDFHGHSLLKALAALRTTNGIQRLTRHRRQIYDDRFGTDHMMWGQVHMKREQLHRKKEKGTWSRNPSVDHGSQGIERAMTDCEKEWDDLHQRDDGIPKADRGRPRVFEVN